MSTGKVCVVTGASSGIGYAIAEALIRAGHTVYGLARRRDRMAGLADLGGHPRSVDITDEAAADRVIEEILAEHERIDVLVNNAGVGLYGAVEDVNTDDVRRVFEVNVFAAARLTRLVLPGMRRNGSGRIVMISSIGGVISLPLGGWYHATKHALEGLTDCLRIEVAPFGVRVILIEPGLVKSEFQDDTPDQLRRYSTGGSYEKLAAKMADRIAGSESGTGRFSEPAVVADAVLKAIDAERPRARYSVGFLAKPLLIMERILPTRVFDKIMTPRE